MEDAQNGPGRVGRAARRLRVLPVLLAVLSAHPSEAQMPQADAVRPVGFERVRVADGLWSRRQETNRRITIPYTLDQCERTGRLSNFAKAGGLREGVFEGQRYDDSAVFKVIEGASRSLALAPDPELEQRLDQVIRWIAAAQEEDGYLYTARTAAGPQQPAGIGPTRWSRLSGSHELYNVGHLYEAAAAHFRATGRRDLLDVALRTAELVAATFGPDGLREPPGHPQIELGLLALADVSGDSRWIALARFFLDVRGPAAGRTGTYGAYAQDHARVVDQHEAVGHAVRAGYLYAAMADVAARTGDADLLRAVDQIWEDVVGSKLYVTGGIGARRDGEAFGAAFELPNATAYSETCAAIANILWNQAMFLLHRDAKYVDVLERALLNGFLSGVSLKGDRFFYPNPLGADGTFRFNQGGNTRQPWFTCSCCPVNLARSIPAVGGLAYAAQGSTDVWINLFVPGSAHVPLGNGDVLLTTETEYPWDGHVRITVDPGSERPFALHIRIPGWARGEPVPGGLYGQLVPGAPEIRLAVGDESVAGGTQAGYAVIRRLWKPGDVVRLDLPMPVRRLIADERVEADRGRVVLERGPLVYCVEAIDNPDGIAGLVLPDDAPVQARWRPDLLGGVMTLTGPARRVVRDAAGTPATDPAMFTAVPYHAWSNRGAGAMAVWLARSPEAVELAPAPTLASEARPFASHVGANDTLSALNDRLDPDSSGDHVLPRMTWWPHRGGTEWVQYEFGTHVQVRASEVYWFDDRGRGGCRVPRGWRLLYRVGDLWRAVPGAGTAGVARDTWNRLAHDPVTTTALRLEADLQAGFSSGILEWRVE